MTVGVVCLCVCAISVRMTVCVCAFVIVCVCLHAFVCLFEGVRLSVNPLHHQTTVSTYLQATVSPA